MKTAIWTALALAIIFQTVIVSSQTINTHGSVHGTINIFLANGNGLVAITDSRLSDDIGPVGYGQKLFKVDDQTVCSIAGFFSWHGPVFPGTKAYLLPTAVPAVLNAYIKVLHDPDAPPKSLQAKFEGLARAWQADLNMMLELGQMTRQVYIPPQASVITIGGYDNGALWIGQVSLMPTTINNLTSFAMDPAKPVLQKVATTLVYAAAGYDSEVETILDSPGSTPDNDPIFAKYSKSMATDSGASLTLDDLEILAKKLETISAAKYKKEVGGDQQLAVLKSGKVSSSPPAPKNDSLGQTSFETQLSSFNITYIGGRHVWGRLPPERIDILFNDSFRKAVVQIDDRVEIDSFFSDCTLYYEGSPLVVFESNGLQNTDLQLGPQVPLDNPFVREFQGKYPNVKVIPWPNSPTQQTRTGAIILNQKY